MSNEKRVVFSTSYVENITKKLDDGFQISRAENPFFMNIQGVRRENLTFRMNKEELDHYIKCKLDVKYFANHFCKVKVEDGSYRLIKLRDYQIKILEMFDDNQFSILMASRQVGKTISSAIYILHYMLFNNTKNILIAANKFDTAVEIMDKIKDIYMGLPFFLKQGVSVWNQRTVKFENGCRMKAFTMTKTSSIGNTADFVYVDEFAYIHNNIAEAFYKSIQPTLISVDNSKMIITSTPNGINLFQKLLTDAERPEDDPLRNNFGNMRVYWHQVPGRSVTYIKLKPLEMAKYNIKTDDIFDLVKEEFDPNHEFDTNGLPFVCLKKDPNNSRPIINVLNREDLTKDDVLGLQFTSYTGEKLPISVIADISTWKDDAIKDIGSPEAFAQEYDLRFINTSKSIFTEETIHRLEMGAVDFKHRKHEVFGTKLKWDYSALKWVDDDSIFNEANRKKIKGIISVDVSEGLGLDYSVINIFRISPKPMDVIEDQQPFYQNYVDFFQLEQIGMFRSNVVSVTQLTEILYLIAFEFFNDDNFKIVLEINNHGLAVFTGMKSVFDDKNNYGSHIFMKFKHRQDAPKKKIGIKVGGNKKLMVKDYQEKIEDQDIIVYERNNIREITTFIKNVTSAGNVKYEADGSSNDDTVMTLVNMSQVFDDNIYRDMVEEIMKEIGNTEVGKYINQAAKNVDYTEGIDYQALINVNKRRRVIDRRNQKIDEGESYSNELRRGL